MIYIHSKLRTSCYTHSMGRENAFALKQGTPRAGYRSTGMNCQVTSAPGRIGAKLTCAQKEGRKRQSRIIACQFTSDQSIDSTQYNIYALGEWVKPDRKKKRENNCASHLPWFRVAETRPARTGLGCYLGYYKMRTERKPIGSRSAAIYC